MKPIYNRYTPQMLVSLANQSLGSLVINALVRAVIFTAMIQLLSFLSGLQVSNVIQMLVLVLVFSLFIVSFDIIEKYWAQSRISKRS
jgi:hypothetical protein